MMPGGEDDDDGAMIKYTFFHLVWAGWARNRKIAQS